MKDFLTDFYNKVINFFQAEKVEGENTKETAKNRLKLVLMQDRSNLEPETMAQLRVELIEVISKYIVIDKEALGLNLDGDGESMALMLNIPVIRAKKPEEIQEALEAAKAKLKETEENKEEEIAEETESAENNEEESPEELENNEENKTEESNEETEIISDTNNEEEIIDEKSIVVEVETVEDSDAEIKESKKKNNK